MVSVGYRSSRNYFGPTSVLRKLLRSCLIAVFLLILELSNDQIYNILIISKPQLFNRQKSALFSVFFSFGHKIELRLFSVISKFWFGSVSVLEKQCRSYTFGGSVK